MFGFLEHSQCSGWFNSSSDNHWAVLGLEKQCGGGVEGGAAINAGPKSRGLGWEFWLQFKANKICFLAFLSGGENLALKKTQEQGLCYRA